MQTRNPTRDPRRRARTPLLLTTLFLALLGGEASAQQPEEIIDATGDGSTSLNGPTAIAVDPAGNTFVAGGSGPDSVFRIAPDGIIEGVLDASGDGVNALDFPDVLDFDPAGTLYVRGVNSANVFRVRPSGEVAQIAGSADGVGVSGDMIVDAAGNVFVASFFDDNVIQAAPDGVVSQVLGTADGLVGPGRLRVDPAGNLFVAGQDSRNVLKRTPDGVVTEVFDQTADGIHPVASVGDIALDAAGNLYVSASGDPSGEKVFKVTPGGTVTLILDETGGGIAPLSFVTRLEVDPFDDLFVVGFSSDNVFRVSPAGVVSQVISASGDGVQALDGPDAIVFDAAGTLFVGGGISGNVFRRKPSGSLDVVLDGSVPGTSGLDSPRDMTVDAAGSLYVDGFSSDNAYRVSFFDVADDFDADGSGIGWSDGWESGATYRSDFGTDPGRPRHVRSDATAFRDLDPTAASRIDAHDEVWIAFDIRLDRLKNTSEFAGLSLFAGASEVFFMGALFDTVPWGVGTGASLSTPPTTPAGAEWARLMTRLDFAGGLIEFYVNGVLEGTGTDLPVRGWTRARLASGANGAYLDRLRIGPTRESVEGAEPPRFVATDTDRLAVLDGNRDAIRDHAAPAARGLATDGKRIFLARSFEIVVYASNAAQELYRFSGLLDDPSGLAWLDGTLVVLEPVIAVIDFYDPDTGVLERSINYQCDDGSDPDGITVEGEQLWVLCNTAIDAVDPQTGLLDRTIANAASGCFLGGTSLTASAPGELTIGCADGSWFRVSTDDGSTIDSGSNGLVMGGLTYVPEPGGIGLGLGGLAVAWMGRRRLRASFGRKGPGRCVFSIFVRSSPGR